MAATAQQAVVLPRTNIFALTNGNQLFVLRPGQTTFSQVGTISGIGIGTQVIGMDFRASNGQLYALTDTGVIYTLNTSSAAATQVSTLNPTFRGGVQSLFDFNTVVDAVRIIGSNTQNYAAVGAQLNTTAVQTSLAYAAGDRNAGTTPNIVGGAYSNSLAGATVTIFYMVDSATSSLVTIAQKNATGSSNTGGGQLQTIGQIFDNNLNAQNGGRPVNITPTADLDIFTDPVTRVDTALLVTGNRLIAFNPIQVNQNLRVGQSQNLGGAGISLGNTTGLNFIDVAAQPAAATQASR
ncbi:MAG TPA: DUF4394 domain-containing protein [Blastocatellia bacterium]|nr:DUF4394 domain-containing protein [Blastocatellia bacterium]